MIDSGNMFNIQRFIIEISMKKILTVLFLAVSVHLVAQNPLITGIVINMPASPDPNTANWGTGTSVFTISASTTPNFLKEAMNSSILVGIRKGGAKVCGAYTNATAPASSFNKITMIWSGKNAVSLMGQDCTLSPGEYELCVQFFLQGRKVSEGVCKAFTVKPQETIAYQAPQAISPADGTILNPADAKKPLPFRWTPIVPKPRDMVNYKFKIFEVKQGQTASSALKTGLFLFEKEISNLTQFILPSPGQLMISSGSNYGWVVQALDIKGNPMGRNEGQSDPFSFLISDKGQNKNDTTLLKIMGGAIAEFGLDSAICLPQENGLFKYHIWAHYENKSSSVDNILINDSQPFAGYPANPNPGPGLNLRNNIRLKSGSYNGLLTMSDILEASSGSINNINPVPSSGFTPPSLAPNTIHNFQFDYSTATNSPVQFTYYGLVDDALKDKPNRNARNEIDSLRYPQCPCSACEEITINPKPTGQIQNNGNGSLSLPVSLAASPKKVKRIRAELVYFDMKPDDENCLICNRNSNTFGNFIAASTTGPGFSGGVTAGHSVQFDALTDTNISGGIPINYTISIPPIVACCNAKVNFCIRYILTFEDCIVCDVLACYAYDIIGCPTKK
jgi:hypothetical protein